MDGITIFDLAWLIPLCPLLAFVVIALFAHRSRAASRQLAIYGIVASTALAAIMFVANMITVIGGQSPEIFTPSFGPWFSLGTHTFLIGIYIDQLNALMLPVLGLACLVIFIYSTGIMQGDPRESRFFALLSLLAAGVLGLLVFDNLLLFFVFWVLMDACAYLLVGLGHEKSARAAALKVFLVAGFGDLLLLFGLVLLLVHAGSLTYDNVFYRPETLQALAGINFLGTRFPVVVVVALFFFGAAMVKSGQCPFHAWLPEATRAPAPAAALIHTATAFAGIFLLIRAFPLLDAAAGVLLIPELGLTIVAIVGILTAVLAALVAATQRDMWRTLSFFVMGQLGYAVTALGMGAYVPGVLHLVASVLFNVLLFLAAGSVAHGVRRGRQGLFGDDALDLDDMFNLGGLGERQPYTFVLFLAGGAALIGAPFLTAGFWSKEAILAWAWESNLVVFWILALTAAVTAFAVMRQLGLIFVGAPRSRAAVDAVEGGLAMIVPLVFLVFIIVIVVGWAGAPIYGKSVLELFLGSPAGSLEFVGEKLIGDSMALWSAVGVVGLAFGFLIYVWQPVRAGEVDWIESLVRAVWLGWLYELLRSAFYVDGLFYWIAKLAAWLGRGLALGDGVLGEVVADAVHWIGRGSALAGGWLDAQVLTPLFRPVDRAAKPVAQAAGWVDVGLGVPADWLRHLGKYPARAAGALDLGLDYLVNLTKPGTLALARLGAMIETWLAVAVISVGRAIYVSGLWFRPRTGNVQDYLRLAFVAVTVLAMMVLLFLFIQI